jgi:TonB family protein
MGRRFLIFFLALATVAASATLAQDADTSPHERKVVRRVIPVYPELAMRLQIAGVVKLWVTVAPNGSVKLIEPVGGNPLLIKAAQEAVTSWKFAPAPDETRQLVELHFNRP